MTDRVPGVDGVNPAAVSRQQAMDEEVAYAVLRGLTSCGGGMVAGREASPRGGPGLSASKREIATGATRVANRRRVVTALDSRRAPGERPAHRRHPRCGARRVGAARFRLS